MTSEENAGLIIHSSLGRMFSKMRRAQERPGPGSSPGPVGEAGKASANGLNPILMFCHCARRMVLRRAANLGSCRRLS
jgi:hypothetical protein